ncbi:DUF1223 domain-containing protein [Paracoccus sp. NSM]|uniref:DUF1223 domain-containing protein n=1 Tax=Paracoccus sp. NSM TaxID=3457784 RepID=UPI004035E913
MKPTRQIMAFPTVRLGAFVAVLALMSPTQPLAETHDQAASQVEAGPAAGNPAPDRAPDHAPDYAPDYAADYAPVISAPDYPGRTSPDAIFSGQGAPAFNSFSGSDAQTPAVTAMPQASALPVVVELFTSQGCSSCPPADAMLAMMAQDPQILALAYHVDYWDYLGWADVFARPEFTARQEAYARAAGERSIYTPQLIVAGRDTALAPGPAQLMGLIDAARYRPAMVTVQREGDGLNGTIEVMPLSDLGGRVDVSMVRYLPEREVEVTAGENRGRVVTHVNIVQSVETLAAWDGVAPLRLTVRPGEGASDQPPDLRHALLIQQMQQPYGLPGPILAAIRLD